MKKATRFLTLGLSLLTFCGALAACGGDNGETTTVAASTQGPADSQSSKLPEIYWDEDYNILGYTNSTFGFVAEDNTNSIDSAVIRRNFAIEEKYGITVKQENVTFSGTEYNMYNRINKEYMTGKTGIELISIGGADIHCMINDETVKLYDLYDSETMPYLDFDAKCWNQEADDALSINGKLFFTTGDLNLTEKMNAALIMYNRNILATISNNNPADLVRSGDWTMEAMAQLVKDATVTDSGSGTTSIYGFTVNNPQTFWNFNAACGIRLIEKDDRDLPYFCIADSSHMQITLNTIDKALALLINNNSSTFYSRYSNTNAEAVSKFTGGKALFFSATMDDIRTFKKEAFGFTYGYLPYPKYDTNQMKYYANIDISRGALLAVPAVVSDPELASFGLQALGENSTEMNQLYVENQCKLQGSLDEEQYDMLTIALEHPIYDLGAIMDWGALRTWIFVDYNPQYPSIPIAKENNFTTLWESFKELAQTELDRFIAAVK